LTAFKRQASVVCPPAGIGARYRVRWDDQSSGST
jgi:hypothetical protein